MANEDTLVKAALRVYQLEQDAEDLKDTLQRVARFQVESVSLFVHIVVAYNNQRLHSAKRK